MKTTTLIKADPLAFLSTLQSWQLKHLAFLTGLTSTGTKVQLRKTLSDSFAKPGLRTSSHRILSVDMGVKNLAFCLLDVRQSSRSPNDLSEPHKALDKPSLCLSEWKRLDITERPANRSMDFCHIPLGGSASEGSLKDETADVASVERMNLYTPSTLSKTAFNLASEFMRHRPDTILIERQRFRSGGAPAIQEWTVRVNMLESMLWAVLETMGHGFGRNTVTQDEPFPDVKEMNPRRVGMFWLARGEDVSPVPANVSASLEGPKEKIQTKESALVKKSFEKKDKIALARHWLRPDMEELVVAPSLASKVASFCSPRSRSLSSRRGKKEIKEDEPEPVEVTPGHSGKLDDLADCLVQAVTFTLWEQNRKQILDYAATER